MTPCAPCAEYQRGERENVPIYGVAVHVCERKAGGHWGFGACLCGCSQRPLDEMERQPPEGTEVPPHGEDEAHGRAAREGHAPVVGARAESRSEMAEGTTEQRLRDLGWYETPSRSTFAAVILAAIEATERRRRIAETPRPFRLHPMRCAACDRPWLDSDPGRACPYCGAA